MKHARALESTRDIRLLLPCKVVVRDSSDGDGQTLDPMIIAAVPELEPISAEAGERFRGALDALRGAE